MKSYFVHAKSAFEGLPNYPAVQQNMLVIQEGAIAAFASERKTQDDFTARQRYYFRQAPPLTLEAHTEIAAQVLIDLGAPPLFARRLAEMSRDKAAGHGNHPSHLYVLEPPIGRGFDPARRLEKEVRVQPSGSYHLLTSHWGNVERSEACPFCGGRMIQAAIIDSDHRLDLRAEKEEPSGISLNWADGNYLAVSLCRSCRAFGYHVVLS